MEPDPTVSGFAGHLIKDFLYSNGYRETLRQFTEEVPEDKVSVKSWINATGRLNLAPYIFTYLGQNEFTQTLSFLEGEGIRDNVDLSDWTLCQEKIKSENDFRSQQKRPGSFFSLMEILLEFWINSPEKVRNSLLDSSMKRVEAVKKKEDRSRKETKEKMEKTANLLMGEDFLQTPAKSETPERKTKKKAAKKLQNSNSIDLDAVFGDTTVSTTVSKIPSGKFAEDDENLSPRSLRKKRAKLAKLGNEKIAAKQATSGHRSKTPNSGGGKNQSDALDTMMDPHGGGGPIKTQEQIEFDKLKEEEIKIEEEIIMLQRRLQEKERNSVQNMSKLRNLQDWRKSHFDSGFRKDNLTTDLGMLDQKMKLLGSDLLAMKFDVKEQVRTASIRRHGHRSGEVNAEASMISTQDESWPPRRPFGDQLPKECALCEYKFTTLNLPGRVSYKAIVDLRKTWGVKESNAAAQAGPGSPGQPQAGRPWRDTGSRRANPRGRFPHCYDQVKVCRFCFQFFEVPDDYRSTTIVHEAEAVVEAEAPKDEDEDSEYDDEEGDF